MASKQGDQRLEVSSGREILASTTNTQGIERVWRQTTQCYNQCRAGVQFGDGIQAERRSAA